MPKESHKHKRKKERKAKKCCCCLACAHKIPVIFDRKWALSSNGREKNIHEECFTRMLPYGKGGKAK
jgi:hypothetical protein